MGQQRRLLANMTMARNEHLENHMALSKIEQEVVLLTAVKELIDSVVNFEMFSLIGSDPDSQILFKSSVHQRFFNIVLVDFLSPTDKDKRAPIKQISYVGALKEIANTPCFNVDNSVDPLGEATRQFAEWLEQKIEVDVWLPSIGKTTRLHIDRVCFLKMCGNISKHNFLRCVGVAIQLQKALTASGVPVVIEDALVALADFYGRFHSDILNYHSSTIAEFLNNIRWGIYDYLQPEFQRSIVWETGEPPKYRYAYPSALTAPLAKHCYWGLMNEVRTPPYIRRFEVTKWLKLRYEPGALRQPTQST
jgi:hypothetical protein